MAEITGYYYLHESGDLLFKRMNDGLVEDLRESTFVRAFWPIDAENRETAWTILVEALAAGARHERVMELAGKWRCTDTDANEYSQRVGCTLARDGSQWHAYAAGFENIQESPSGFGPTCLEAMAALAKELKFTPAKLWGASFKDLLALQKAGPAS